MELNLKEKGRYDVQIKELTKIIIDWIKYEHFLSKLEAVGFSLVPEHPLWVTSNHYGDFISTKYNISCEELYEMLSPAFKNPTMTEEDVKNYAINCTQILLTENKSSL